MIHPISKEKIFYVPDLEKRIFDLIHDKLFPILTLEYNDLEICVITGIRWETKHNTVSVTVKPLYETCIKEVEINFYLGMSSLKTNTKIKFIDNYRLP